MHFWYLTMLDLGGFELFVALFVNVNVICHCFVEVFVQRFN